MLEERAAQWKDEYIRLGKMKGKAEGINLALNELPKARFGALPADLPAKLFRASDPNTLKALIPSAYAAES